MERNAMPDESIQLSHKLRNPPNDRQSDSQRPSKPLACNIEKVVNRSVGDKRSNQTTGIGYFSPQENVRPALTSGRVVALPKKFGSVRPRTSPKTPIGPQSR